MAENEKLTILNLMDLLLDRTDRDHTMTADMICTTLEKDYEIVCSRKTVYCYHRAFLANKIIGLN